MVRHNPEALNPSCMNKSMAVVLTFYSNVLAFMNWKLLRQVQREDYRSSSRLF